MAKAENHPKPKKRAKKSAKLVDVTEGLSPMNLNAAGIAVGSAEHYLAVPIGRSTSGAEVRLLHRGAVSHGEVAVGLGREVGGDASQRRLLDRALPDSGRTRSRGQGDQRALYPEVARGQE